MGIPRRLVAAALIAQLTGCSFLMLEPLPARRDETKAPACNADGAPVLFDGLLAALFIVSGFGIAAAADDPATPEDESESTGAIAGSLAVSVVGGGFFIYSAVRGRRMNARCRAAWADFGTVAPR